MRRVRLGGTGVPVSRQCLGGLTFGLQGDAPAPAAIVDRARAGAVSVLEVEPLDDPIAAIDEPRDGAPPATRDDLTRECRRRDDPR
jgi:hypothetical protein